MKKILLVFSIVFLTMLSVFAENEPVIMPSQTGIVSRVEYVDFGNQDNIQTKQVAEIKLLGGDYRGTFVTVDNMLTGNPYYDIRLKKGTKVVLHVEDDNGEYIYSIEDVKRSDALLLLAALFCGLLVYVGRKKGLFSLVSITLTCLLIYYILSPMILHGINPLCSTVLICLISTSITMYMVGGLNKKSTSAILGCILSLIIAGFLSFLTVKFASLTGFINENSVFLYTAHPELNFVHITISMIVLATLGAVMDVGMSIASTINEIYMLDNNKTVFELFQSGMNVGRDIIGTMANTLILVYVGGALPLLLLSSNIDMQKFLNLNQVVTEIASALIGSIAIVICVPITAFVASELVRKKHTDIDFSNLKN